MGFNYHGKIEPKKYTASDLQELFRKVAEDEFKKMHRKQKRKLNFDHILGYVPPKNHPWTW